MNSLKQIIKRAVITGPTGAVGVALINELISNNIETFCICHKSSKRINNIPNDKLVHIIYCNIDEYDKLTNLIDCKIDAFFHFAWMGTYGEARNDLTMQTKNIEYSLVALKIAKELGCSVFVGAGSQSEYGPSNVIKYPYDYCDPDNFYGAAKLSTMKMCKVLANKLDVRFIWCRIFSLYGPCDAPYTMIMSSINKMLNNQTCEFTKGEQIWDYIYSKDAAKAFRLVAEKGKNNSIYCFASGKTRKLKDYIISMHELVNVNSEIKIGALPYYEHQAMNLSADISNLKNDTGFEPSFSFEDGIKDLLKEIKK